MNLIDLPSLKGRSFVSRDGYGHLLEQRRRRLTEVYNRDQNSHLGIAFLYRVTTKKVMKQFFSNSQFSERLMLLTF